MQLRKSFPLDQAARITGYLDDLGISHLYLSPILEARAESNHGYDAIDVTKISEERGGEAGFERLVSQVEKSKNIEGLILDIVPNHVAASWKNPAWWDVLKEGPASKFWTTFDIRPREGGDRRVVLPVLGRSRQAILASRELRLSIMNDELVLKYWDNYFPVAGRSHARILRALAGELSETSGKATQWKAEILKIATKGDSPESGRQVARSFSQWLSKNPVGSRVVSLSLRALPLKLIEATLEEQNYALEDWRGGSRVINYRRFFDINDLAAIRIEDEKTFKWAHQKIHDLVKKYPIVHGLRVDHVDGLTDPEGYLRRLCKISKQVWVEKILGEGEHVPKPWPVKGTTGYEFSNTSARLFVDLPGLLHLHSHYTRHIDRRWERFHDCVYDSKREMLDSHFVSELNYLTEQFFALANRGRKGAGFTREDLKIALRELTSSLRVYRTYFASGEGTDQRWLEDAFAEVEGRGRLTEKNALNWLRSILLGKGDWSEPTAVAIKRWEQLTGPVMAKGLEDTALYRYFPLLSLNVVGGEPDWTGDGAIEFHAFNQDRLRTQPLTMNATSTHDTKRSEDVRSRIHVISELSEEWTGLFETWHKINAGARGNSERPIPDLPIEYLMYETLLGAWPLDGKIDEEFAGRMKQYFMKAVRESKSETSWTEPDQDYESKLMKFVDTLLFSKEKKVQEFQKSFRSFAEKCAYFGAFNSLTLLTLKVTSPGLPDFYQGCDMWDLSLVDPDNRRPVDYQLRHSLLKQMKRDAKENPRALRTRLVKNWKSGEIKLWLTQALLKLRCQDPALFTQGEYYALEPQGAGKRHFLSFMRKFEGRWALIVVPRFLASKMANGKKPGQDKSLKKLEIDDEVILSTEIPLLPTAPRKWKNAFTGQTYEADSLIAEDVLDGLPVAVLTSEV